ncbi:MAG: cation:proton antiporter [Mycobacterium sp.]
MSPEALTVMGTLIFCYALVARRATLANFTAPMLSILAGTIVFSATTFEIHTELVHATAEIALVVVLFHDASTVQLSRLSHDPGIALRLLGIGFPLALVATFLVAHWMLPAVGVAGAWLIAAAITPTDAGLGAPTVLNPVVPVRARRALNVESGLNDGLATPIVLLALSALAAQEGAYTPILMRIGVVQVLLALVTAGGIGLLAAWLVDRSRAQHLSARRGRQIATLVLPLVMFGVADLIHANAFITAFVGGLVFGAACRTAGEEHETAGLLDIAADLLGFVVWFALGGLLVLGASRGVSWRWVLIAVLALTVLRMMPVAIAMIGTGLKWPTVAFLGWFGPRGLATIVFGLLTLEELGSNSPVIGTINGVLAVTVLLSVFAHGFSAAPLARAYGAWADRNRAPISTEPSVEPMPRRRHWL